MTKKRPPFPFRYVFWLVSKLVIALSLVLYFFALLRLHSHSKQQVSNIVDAGRSRNLVEHFVGTPKIAFLFLARKDLPLDFLWGSFFEVVQQEHKSEYEGLARSGWDVMP